MLDDYVKHLAECGIVNRFDSLSEREREVFQLAKTIQGGDFSRPRGCRLAKNVRILPSDPYNPQILLDPQIL